MRLIYLILLLPVIFFLLLFIYVRLAGPIPFTVNSITTTKSDSFQVSGQGKVSAPPDLAVINVGVAASGATVKEAQDKLNVNINAVSAAIKKLAVDPKDIQTTNYNINPNYDYQSGDNQKITGYSANTNLTIKVRKIDQASQVVDAATSAGANQVGGISFDISDKTKLENEAREQAVADAKNKAAQAARIAGFQLGKVLNYSESFAGIPVPMMAMNAVDARGSAEKVTQVETGSSEVVVNVTLSFEVR